MTNVYFIDCVYYCIVYIDCFKYNSPLQKHKIFLFLSMRSRHFDLLSTSSDSVEYIKIITSVTKQLKNYQVGCTFFCICSYCDWYLQTSFYLF